VYASSKSPFDAPHRYQHPVGTSTSATLQFTRHLMSKTHTTLILPDSFPCCHYTLHEEHILCRRRCPCAFAVWCFLIESSIAIWCQEFGNITTHLMSKMECRLWHSHFCCFFISDLSGSIQYLIIHLFHI
jgi:hypothetical protein